MNPDHWALTPDPANVKTWRLPLVDADGAFDARRVAYALGRLSPDASPTIPYASMATARARVKAAFEALYPGRALPKTLARLAKDDDGGDDDDEPTGLCVMLSLSPLLGLLLEVDADGALAADDLHVTLAYLGDVSAFAADELLRLQHAVTSWALATCPIDATVSGFGVFLPDPDEDAPAAAVALVDGGQSLADLRASLVATLESADLYPYREHGFVPHITLAYGDPDAVKALPLPPQIPLAFTAVTIAAGPSRTAIPLLGHVAPLGDDMMVAAEMWKSAGEVTVADDELRYTLAPVYAPDLFDSHGDITDPAELELAQWAYLRNGDLAVRLQHVPDVVAGETVGMITWPFPVSATLTTGDGVTKSVDYPAGTVFQGVVWERWAWDMVKAGRLRGLSMGGSGYRVPVD